MGGTLFPAVTDATSAHVLHRWVAAIVGPDRRRPSRSSRWRTQRDTRRSSASPSARPCCSPIQVVVGGAAGPDPAVGLDADAPSRPRARSIWALLVGARRCRYYDGARRRASRRLGTRRRSPGRRRRRRRDRRRGPRGDTRPRLHRPDQAADHRAAPGHDRPGHGPRHARGARHPARPTGPGSSSGR